MTHNLQQLESALETLNEYASCETDGVWLEQLAVKVAPFLREWDIAECHLWADWPDRERAFPNLPRRDLGIDAVAVRRGDGCLIAIQCKARRLDGSGRGPTLGKDDIDSFAHAAAGDLWAERWLVVNGDIPVSRNVLDTAQMAGKPLLVVNLANDLQKALNSLQEDGPVRRESEESRQGKTDMQNEAVSTSVRILREHVQTDSGGLPAGQARGKIILPCGTGKTRISLRIVEELTGPGQLSVVLCPSIALVAQLRSEYLQHADAALRVLAVCSDKTAGYNPKKEGTAVYNTATDPTVDNSQVSESEIKGAVTTDPQAIASWITEGQASDHISIVFGTYQSGRALADGLELSGAEVQVMVCDEAHRTAGLRRKRSKSRKQAVSDLEQRIRDFTLCHDQDAIPATYRIYQTATPRIYDTSGMQQAQNADWYVRSMDDETVFGVELYRRSYVEAVQNGWLADYRIIAIGIQGDAANTLANDLARDNTGARGLTTTGYLRGLALALAMGGAVLTPKGEEVDLRSCIGFMNTVAKSKRMAQDLQLERVRDYVRGQLADYRPGHSPVPYTLEHLDASSKVIDREAAKRKLSAATEAKPHGILNVGIFGEGVDAPTLSAVAFLEPRKSPIDVVQAVGRAMRTSPGKEMGYIICPVVIPPNADPETWLSHSSPEDGWKELGDILLALRAHDQRIEDNLGKVMKLYLPTPPKVVRTIVAVANPNTSRIQYREHLGKPGDAEAAVERVANGQSTLKQEFQVLTDPLDPKVVDAMAARLPDLEESLFASASDTAKTDAAQEEPLVEHSQIVTAKRHADGSVEVRRDSVKRDKPASDGTRGAVNTDKSKQHGRKMINNGEGRRVRIRRKNQDEAANGSAVQATPQALLRGLEEHGPALRLNLLERSGLTSNRVVRDLNLLDGAVTEASRHLRADGLGAILDRYFTLDNLSADKRAKQADGCTIAALLMMNAAMLHQRIANGQWLQGISDLAAIKNETRIVDRLTREWERITRYDFKPVMVPATEAIYAVEDSGRLAGLERALRHLTAEAERIAEAYADMGADHAGALFNKVMGNQDSDGAFFTRPVAAMMAARLTLDACGEADWTDPDVWRAHRTVDLACGSGTLLTAVLTEMKRRARVQGATQTQLAVLQKVAVEDVLKGLDINPVSLQLAAAQLTAGNVDVQYRRMGLHLMPYGPREGGPVAAGTLELLDQKAIVPRHNELDLDDERIRSQAAELLLHDDAELEDAVDAMQDTRIVIMNPPFTNRAKMGEKYPSDTKKALSARVDYLAGLLTKSDSGLADMDNKNSLAPQFVGLADKLVGTERGVLALLHPVSALSTADEKAVGERIALAKRYHIHTILTCHQPNQVNLSQDTGINECIIIARRHAGTKPSTRFISLDRLPTNEAEVDAMFNAISHKNGGGGKSRMVGATSRNGLPTAWPLATGRKVRSVLPNWRMRPMTSCITRAL